MKRTDAINYVMKEMGLNSILEIGVQAGHNKNMLKAKEYVGVDPDQNTPANHHMTSDDFFRNNKKKFDFIFIDGQHTAEQSLKDFDNALDHLNEGGVIAFHDTLPHNKVYTGIDWCGEVWVTAVRLVQSGFRIVTASWDHGVTFVFPNADNLPFREDVSTEYPGIDKLKELLNAVDTLEELVALPEPQMTKEAPVDDKDISSMSVKQLKELHKEKIGTVPRGIKKSELIEVLINA